MKLISNIEFFNFWEMTDMRRQWTKEEMELMRVFEPYMDNTTHKLKKDAPKEAKEALEKCIKIGDEMRYAECFGLPCKYDY